MVQFAKLGLSADVALLVEGVGRNQFAVPWELLPLGCLLTEGVDRNMYTL